jgi:hypothetical protein
MNEAKQEVKVAPIESLQELLDRYWEGETTPEEELRLHLLLLGQPKESRYRQELAVIEGMMAEAEQLKPKTLKFHLRQYLIVAASAIILLGGSGYLTHSLRKMNQSTINGVPLYQADVNDQAERAYRMLHDCFQESITQREALYQHLNETDNLINASLDQLQVFADPAEYTEVNE